MFSKVVITLLAIGALWVNVSAIPIPATTHSQPDGIPVPPTLAPRPQSPSVDNMSPLSLPVPALDTTPNISPLSLPPPLLPDDSSAPALVPQRPHLQPTPPGPHSDRLPATDIPHTDGSEGGGQKKIVLG